MIVGHPPIGSRLSIIIDQLMDEIRIVDDITFS